MAVAASTSSYFGTRLRKVRWDSGATSWTTSLSGGVRGALPVAKKGHGQKQGGRGAQARRHPEQAEGDGAGLGDGGGDARPEVGGGRRGARAGQDLLVLPDPLQTARAGGAPGAVPDELLPLLVQGPLQEVEHAVGKLGAVHGPCSSITSFRIGRSVSCARNSLDFTVPIEISRISAISS